MARVKGFLLFCKGDGFWEVPHRRKPPRCRHITPEMLPLAPCPGFQQHLGSPGMAVFIFSKVNPPTTMYTVHSDSGWCKLPLSHEEAAQLLLELCFLPPAKWLK